MALPVDFISRTRTLLGDEYEAFEQALHSEPPVSIRTNPFKCNRLPAESEPVLWCGTGCYLPSRPSFTSDPYFHAGAYYVQEASSMFVEQVVRTYVTNPSVCLDLCAAPGGKSTHLRAILPEGSVLVSNEVVRTRANILAENIAKWGHPDCIVTNASPGELGELHDVFDMVLADVPCSGEGMFRKDPASRSEWSVENVALCASRQKDIIRSVWGALKPGGILVYSTCTYNTEEDEDTIHYIIETLGAEPLPIPANPSWNITGALKYSYPACRFFPHKTRGEGFFIAALRKEAGEAEPFSPRKAKAKRGKGRNVQAFPRDVESYLLEGHRFRPVWAGAEGTHLLMLPEEVSRIYELLRLRGIRILLAGTGIGEMRGKDLVPSQALAMSILLDRERFPSVEIGHDAAIRYLRKEAGGLPPGTERGFVLLTYRGLPLGFVKNLGTRCNNLYPQEWRIRSASAGSGSPPSLNL